MGMQKSQKGRISAAQQDIEVGRSGRPTQQLGGGARATTKSSRVPATGERRKALGLKQKQNAKQRPGGVGSWRQEGADYIATPGSPSLSELRRYNRKRAP